MTSAALILLAHGTRDALGPTELASLAERVAAALPNTTVRLAFLSLVQPTPEHTIAEVVDAGCERVVLLPLLLTNASHVRDDVPAIVAAAADRHREIAVSALDPLGFGDGLADVAAARLRPYGDGLDLVVLGRGGSDRLANDRFQQLVADLGAGLGARSASSAFAALAEPSLQTALEDRVAHGAPRIVFFAWLLAHGKLVAQASDTLHVVAGITGVEIVDAGYFGPDPRVVDLVVAQARAEGLA